MALTEVILDEISVEAEIIGQEIDVILHDPDPIEVLVEEGLEGKPGLGAVDPGDLTLILQLAAL